MHDCPFMYVCNILCFFLSVIAMDSDIVALYEKIKQTWKYRLKAELKELPVVSIGGGRRDVLVRSDLILNHFEHSSGLDIHTLVSIKFCKLLIFALVIWKHSLCVNMLRNK